MLIMKREPFAFQCSNNHTTGIFASTLLKVIKRYEQECLACKLQGSAIGFVEVTQDLGF
jgi:hypothetical protein